MRWSTQRKTPMEWQPISEVSIWDLLNQSIPQMRSPEERLWEAMRIIPEKWGLSQNGDTGGCFWVVGLIARRVIRYNDIEEGFNLSLYSAYGVIDEYKCDQDSLESAVQRVLFLFEE